MGCDRGEGGEEGEEGAGAGSHCCSALEAMLTLSSSRLLGRDAGSVSGLDQEHSKKHEDQLSMILQELGS